jgi:hypothetical protein
MNWQDILKTLAPTVATAVVGPLGGVAVKALGDVLGVDAPTQKTIADALTQGQLTPEQIGKLKELELQFQNDEKERGFKYAELAYKDREGARQANVTGGVQKELFWLSILLLAVTLGTECTILFQGIPSTVDDLVAGRILGLLDGLAMTVVVYWYGTTNSSAQKTELLAKAQPIA